MKMENIKLGDLYLSKSELDDIADIMIMMIMSIKE